MANNFNYSETFGSYIRKLRIKNDIGQRELAKKIHEVYDMSKEERVERGLAGREWVTSKESGMTSKNMAKNIIKYVEETFINFVPRKNFTFEQIEEIKPKTLRHKLIY